MPAVDGKDSCEATGSRVGVRVGFRIHRQWLPAADEAPVLDSVPAEPLGDAVDASRAIRDAIIRIQSALCSEAVGAMEEALRLTTDYLKTRKQFGVTLNKFQALTQRAADMYVSLDWPAA